MPCTDDLHLAIQDLFDFDNDHLYAFYLNGNDERPSGHQVYADPRGDCMDDEKPADLFKISELGFFPGKEICYVFDFGEHWRFSIIVLDIEAGAKVAGKYKLLKS